MNRSKRERDGFLQRRRGDVGSEPLPRRRVRLSLCGFDVISQFTRELRRIVLVAGDAG